MKNCSLLSSALVVLSTAVPAHAQQWTSSAGGNWTTPANWDSDPASPANDGTADITFNTLPATLTSVVDVPYSINSLTFGPASGNWALSGSVLTIGSGGILNNLTAGNEITISAPITLGDSQAWNTGSSAGTNRSILLSGAITGTADKTITISGPQSLTNYRRFVVGISTSNNSATLASPINIEAGGRLANGVGTTNGLGTGIITISAGGMVGGTSGASNWANNMILDGGMIGALGDGGGGTHNGNLEILLDSLVNMTRGSDGVVIGGGASSLISGAGNLTQSVDSGITTRTTYLGNTGSAINNTNTGTLTINAGQVQLQKADNIVAWGGNIVINSGGILKFNDFRENQIADIATVTINQGGIWNLSHGGSLNHEKITGLVVNTTAVAFTNDTSAGGARIVLGTGNSSAGPAGIFVNSTGSLSGVGTVNKRTILGAGVLAPGNGGVGALSFSASLVFGADLAANSLAFDLGAPTTAGTTYDTIVTDNLDLGGGALNFASFQFTDAGGLAVGSYTLVSSSIPITNSLGAPLSGPIGALNGTLSISGNNLILTVTSGGSNPYDTWAGSFPGFTPTTADLDFENDGIKNLLEFVFGGNPTTNDSPSIRPTVTASGGDMTISFKRSDLSELAPLPTTVKVQVSDDLATWNPANDITIGPGPTGTGPNGASYTVDDSGTLDAIVVTIPKGLATAKFARVVATR